jgi:hypothetical protein
MLTILEKIAILEDFKTKDWFILDAWEDRDMAWPGNEVVEQMRLELLDFTNFLIVHLQKENQDISSETQKYYDNWETDYFESEEIEFIVEIQRLAMKIAGIDENQIII